ncbi:hypothetical protein JCM11641_004356 [Rhodosporidiobolus odoratus]
MSRQGRSQTSNTRTGPATAIQTTPSASHAFLSSPLDAILAEQGLHRYHLQPPSWRAPWLAEPSPAPGAASGSSATTGRPPTRSASTGNGLAGLAGTAGQNGEGGKAWPMFYSPRDGMEEDQMTEAVVKAGFASKAVVSAETFSAHQHIYEKLKSNDILGNLSRLVSAVQANAKASLPSYGPSTFRLPSRITLTDAKREAWFSDLASPAVPLSKLSRSVPHGYKGEKGLDMLSNRKVDVPRAVWFVRAFGGVEIQSLAKTRPMPLAVSLYTSEFTTVVSEFVRKQLAEVVLPGTPPVTPAPGTPGTPSAGTPRVRSGSLSGTAAKSGIAAASPGLMDEEKRKVWEGKFEYTIRLASLLYEESLLDRPQFLRFLINLLEPPAPPTSSTIGQLPFILLLIENHLSDIYASEPATARLARGCLLRLRELDNAPPSSLSSSLSSSFASLIRSAFLANPDAFTSLLPSPVYPLLTSASSTANADRGRRLDQLLSAEGTDPDGDSVLRETIEADLEDIRLRRSFPLAALSAVNQVEPLSSGDARGPAIMTAARSSDNERVLLAALKKLDDIEFPVKMREVHRALFVSSTPATARTTSAPSSPSNSMAKTTSSSSQPTSSRQRAPASDSTAASGVPSSSSTSQSALPIPLELALPLFFTWATSPTRPAAPHRRYAVARLISLEVDRRTGRSTSSSATNGAGAPRSSARLSAKSREGKSSVSIEDAFIQWVDEAFPAATAVPTTPASSHFLSSRTSTITNGAGDIDKADVRLLAEELIRAGVMSYGAYLQRMIARGETEPRGEREGGEGDDAQGGEPSIHLWILRTVPLAVKTVGPPGAVGGTGGARRRVAVGGKEGMELTLETEERVQTVKRELAKLVFSPFSPEGEQSADPLLSSVRGLVDVGAHWSITREMIPDGLSAKVDAAAGKVRLGRDELAVVVAVYEATHDFEGLLQLLVVLLRLSPEPNLLNHILDVLDTYPSVWTSLEALSELGDALFAFHEAAQKISDGERSRRLLYFLEELASAGHLSTKARDAVHAEAQRSSGRAPPPSQVRSQPLLALIGELQSLLVDSSPPALAQLATSVSSRYAAYSNWAIVALAGVVQLLPQLLSVEVALAFVRALQERDFVVTGTLSQWIVTMSAAQLSATLNGPASNLVVNFFAGAVLDGLVSAPDMLKGVVLPAMRALVVQLLPVGTESQPRQVDPALVHALAALHALVTDLIASTLALEPTMMTEQDIAPVQDVLPSALAAQQRQAGRSAALFTRANLPILAQLLSLLVLQQEGFTTASLPNAADEASSLFLKLSALPQVQGLFGGDPKGLRASMLDGEVIKSIPGAKECRPKLLAAVLLLLKDGGADTPANLVSTEDWDLFLSGLTLWRLPISKVEVEACLERLDLDSSLTPADKAEALNALSQHFIDRVCSGEGQSYLGEQVVKCYHGAASDELVSVSFSRLANAFTSLSSADTSEEDCTSALTTLRCASRLLDTLLRAGNASSRSAALDELLKSIKGFFSQDDFGQQEALADPSTRQVVLYGAHLLVVALGCTNKPSEKVIAELYRDCLTLCAKTAMALSKGRSQHCELASVLLDVCSHILFALPDLSPSSRPPSFLSLLSSDRPSPLNLDMIPDSTFSRLTRLFGHATPTSLIPNPWELLDHTDACTSTSLVRQSGSSTTPHPIQITNLGPIDLASFRTKILETIPAVTALDALSTTSSSTTTTSTSTSNTTPSSSMLEKGLQTNFDFETPCTTLSLPARDHRRTLTITKLLTARIEQGGMQAVVQAQGPAVSAGAGAVGGAAGGGKKTKVEERSAPAPSASSCSTTTTSTGRGTKRKASGSGSTAGTVLTLEDSDEEAQQPSGSGKQPAGPKAKRSRSSVGGKTAATAGKTMTGSGKKKK